MLWNCALLIIGGNCQLCYGSIAGTLNIERASCVSAVYSSEAVRRIDGNQKIGGGSSPERVCEFGVEIVQMNNDLSDTEAALIENIFSCLMFFMLR